MSGPVRPRFVLVPPQDAEGSGRLILRDGSTAHLRPSGPADAAPLADFFRRLSPEATHRRFLSWTPPGTGLAVKLCSGPGVTLVVTRTLEGSAHIIATGSYLPASERIAEVALAVADSCCGCPGWQRRCPRWSSST